LNIDTLSMLSAKSSKAGCLRLSNEKVKQKYHHD